MVSGEDRAHQATTPDPFSRLTLTEWRKFGWGSCVAPTEAIDGNRSRLFLTVVMSRREGSACPSAECSICFKRRTNWHVVEVSPRLDFRSAREGVTEA